METPLVEQTMTGAKLQRQQRLSRLSSPHHHQQLQQHQQRQQQQEGIVAAGDFCLAAAAAGAESSATGVSASAVATATASASTSATTLASASPGGGLELDLNLNLDVSSPSLLTPSSSDTPPPISSHSSSSTLLPPSRPTFVGCLSDLEASFASAGGSDVDVAAALQQRQPNNSLSRHQQLPHQHQHQQHRLLLLPQPPSLSASRPAAHRPSHLQLAHQSGFGPASCPSSRTCTPPIPNSNGILSSCGSVLGGTTPTATSIAAALAAAASPVVAPASLASPTIAPAAAAGVATQQQQPHRRLYSPGPPCAASALRKHCRTRSATSSRHRLPSPPPSGTRSHFSAMSARPAKRSASGHDDGDVSPGETSPSKAKMPRTDRAAEDFSSVIKSRLQSYTRTGQACDRCKVRKIRCDALPEGCSHCVSQNIDCYVTDRVSGRSEKRGYLQQLEREKSDMARHISDLEKLLSQNGVDVHPWAWDAHHQVYLPTGYTINENGETVKASGSAEEWSRSGSVWVRGSGEKRLRYTPRFPRHDLEVKANDKHLGIIQDDNRYTSIKGTQLSILGLSVDIASFDAPDIDEPSAGTSSKRLYNKSRQACIQSIMNVNMPIRDIQPPSRIDALRYADWYFMMVNPFMPILHRPTFDAILHNTYDKPDFKPSVEEECMFHMVMASIYFQHSFRNGETGSKEDWNEMSNKHFHYTLSKVHHLMTSQSFMAVQCLALLVAHCRAFPKPSSGTLLCQFAFQRAIELNLHRRQPVRGGETNLENELRKRTWWTILLIYVTLCGRLGKPMPITVEEFDVEFPEPIADEALTADGVDESKRGRCSFEIGLAAFRVLPMYMEMYSNIYTVKRDPPTYEAVVTSLEKQLVIWEGSLPDSLRLDRIEPNDATQRIVALYARVWSLELRLCLRHPSVRPEAADAKLTAENAQICREASTELRKVVDELLRMRCADSTWYQMSVYVAALFSTLYLDFERKEQTTPEELNKLQTDAAQWVSVLERVADLLGSGKTFKDEISIIVQRTFAQIDAVVNKKAKPAAQPAIKQESHASPLPQPLPQQPLPRQHHRQPLPHRQSHNAARRHVEQSSSDASGTMERSSPKPYYAEQPVQASFQQQMTYHDPGQMSSPPLPQSTAAAQGAYTHDAGAAPMTATAAFYDPGSSHGGQPSHLGEYVPTTNQPSEFLRWPHTTWEEWAHVVGDDHHGAEALITMRDMTDAQGPQMMHQGHQGHPGDVDGVPPPPPHAQTWPLMLYDGLPGS